MFTIYPFINEANRTNDDDDDYHYDWSGISCDMR